MMTDVDEEARACEKVPYGSQEEAWAELFRIALGLPTAARGSVYQGIARERPDREHQPIAAYRCYRCGRWHLTSMLQDEPLAGPPDEILSS